MPRASCKNSERSAPWPYWGHGAQGTRHSPLDQITPEDVDQLKRALVYHTGDMPGPEAEGYARETTPLKIGDAPLMCSGMNILMPIHAATGEENWRYERGVPDKRNGPRRSSRRT